jgi:hypothetical protein
VAAAQTTINRVTVFPSGNAVQVEISASAPVTPQSQVVLNPDRLVIDFPNSVPGSTLHNVSINRGKIKGLRVGLFGNNPPVTRVVVDLEAPQPYEIVPSGSTTVLKINGSPNQTAATPRPAVTPISTHTAFTPVTSSPAPVPVAVTPPAPPAPPQPRMSVDFKNGKLKIFSDRATLAEVLTEVRRRTGAEISIPPAASQEQVFGTIGPAAPRDVMAALLNGSHFNFVMVGADNDPSQLHSVLLTPRDGAPVSVPAISNPQPSAVVENPAEANDNPGAAELEAPVVDETPNPDLSADPAPAENDNSQAEPDMSPRRHHRRGATDGATPPQ